MHIIFGCELDTGSYPDSLGNDEARQGIAVLGPAGLIGVLEKQLGLSGVRTHQAVRIGQYLRRLQAADTGEMFYSQSFQEDSWSTAKQLLAWRDSLVLSGWKGDLPKNSSRRLQELAAIEKAADLELSPGLGDRLTSILAALGNGRKLFIRLLELVEPLGALPYVWDKLFSILSARGIRVEGIPGVTLKESGENNTSQDLAALQRALLERKPHVQPLDGDGSLLVLEGDNEFEVSEVVASWLEAYSGDLSKVLFVTEDGSPVLDEALHTHNLPRLGGESHSRWRTALQVLPLMLTFYWEPFDPYRLLEILTLPKSPIPAWAAGYFEQALREHPGIGGPKWQEAWKSITADYQAWMEQNPDDQPRRSLEAFQDDLQFWLGERRHNPEQGMETSFIQEICAKVAQWASVRGGLEKDDLLISAAAIANAVSDTVVATGLPRITRPQLDRILDSVVGEGLENPGWFPEAAAWSQVKTPGQIWGPAETIIWWNFTSAGIQPMRPPWTLAERAALSATGVVLEDSRQTRLRQAQTWRNPVLWTSRKLILSIPKTLANETVAPHPFWDEVRYLLARKNDKEISKISFRGRELWKTGKTKALPEIINRKIMPVILPPAPQREWQLPNLNLLTRARESATSFQQIIQCPLSWIFKYMLKLYPGDLIDLPEIPQAVGNLAHMIVPEVISQPDLSDLDRLGERARQLYDEYLPQMAAVLGHPGRELERLRYRNAIGQAVMILCDHLRTANLKVLGFETTKQRSLGDGQVFEGRIDLLLATAQNQPIVIDLKWANQSHYKKEELQEGKALQLAAYCWLLEPEAGCFPPGGYYMLAQGELVVSSCPYFPDHHVYSDIDLKDVWQRVFSAYQRRLQELHGGVALAPGVPDECSDDTSGQPSRPECSEEFLEIEPRCDWCDYVNLCGAKI